MIPIFVYSIFENFYSHNYYYNYVMFRDAGMFRVTAIK